MKDTAGGRSAPANIVDALRLSWQASRRYFLLVIVVLPVLEGLLAVSLLVLFKAGSAVFLGGAAGGSAEVVWRVMPWIAAAVVVTLLMMTVSNTRHTVQELLLDRVRQLSARRMHRAIAMLELIDFDDPVVHDRISRAETTADAKPRSVVRGLNQLVASLIQVIALGVLLVVLQPMLLPMMVVAAAPIVLLSAKLAGDQFAFFYAMTPVERRRRYVGRLLIGRATAAEMRSFQMTEHFVARYDDLSDQRYHELRTVVRRQWRRLLAGQVTFGLILCTAVAILGWFFASGRVDTPTLLTAIIALSRLASAVGGLGGPLAELSEAGLFLADQRAFYDQIQRASRRRGGELRPEPLRELVVEGVSFSYPGGDRPALTDVNLTIRAGQMVAFVGPNGSGKTTMAKILAFLYEPESGDVRWNGVSIDEYDREALRQQVTTVFQDPVTYHFTVAENVRLGDLTRAPDPTAVEKALRDAGAAETVAGLPQGVDTPLGPEFEGGTSLSGGEAQRLAIARSFYRARNLVIMDEPTSALDAQADHALFNDLKSLLRGRTAIVISHRFSNVRSADRIFVFHQGRIVEQGTHESLMAAGGLYAEMYALQASPYTAEAWSLETA